MQDSEIFVSVIQQISRKWVDVLAMGHQREGLEDSEVSQVSPAPEGRTPLLV